MLLYMCLANLTHDKPRTNICCLNSEMLKHGWAEIQLLHHRSCQASLGMLLILSMEY